MTVTGLDNEHVVKGLGNRVAYPAPPFAVMTAINNHRLRTNQETWEYTADPSSVSIEQGVQITMQIDLYGANSFDLATLVTTAWRDPWGCDLLAPNCQPLYTDDPRMAPLVDGEDQYEQRWLITAQMQYDAVVSTDQDFAATLAIDVINVDVEYPP